MTIKELSADNKVHNTSLFFTNIEYDFLEHYKNNVDEIDAYMTIKYANLHPLDEVGYSVWRSMNQNALILNAPNYKRMYDALSSEYDPIENYDRKELSITDTSIGSQTNTIQYGDDTQTGQVATDNSETWFNDSKQTNTHGNDSQTSGERADNMVYDSHIHGNIGVTTNQQMIQSELDLRKFNLIERIFDDVVGFSSILVDKGIEVF